MEELIKLIIDFKTLHPLRFWGVIFVGTALLVLMIWELLKSITNQKKQIPVSVKIVVQQSVVEQKIKNKASTIKNLEVKKYDNKSVVGSVEVSEPMLIYPKSIEVEQEKILPKINEIRTKPTPKIKEQVFEIKNDKILPLISEIKPKPKTKEQLPEAKIETAKSKDEVLFVNYESLIHDTTDTYPILRFPKNGTVIRSYRIGNTKRRGYKEVDFQNSIQQFLGKGFLVLGNVRLNTGKETRPFEPDIAIIDKDNLTNLRIDIEIDEPYAGLTRQPTHCKGEDVNRDVYFIDRGWIVIRFSEYQVHLYENECLQFIAQTIKAVSSKYYIANQIENKSSLQIENLWDIVQAQKWEKVKYREQYLNHTFKNVEEQEETIERNFDDQELKEEKFVKSTLIGSVDNKKSISFNLINSHPRDKRIKFYPEPHIYTIDNTPAPSASTIVSKFFPEFDSVYWANKKAPSLGMTPKNVEVMWKTKGEKAAQDGTYLHEQIEKFYLKQDYEKTGEFHLFENFVDENTHVNPYRTEWKIFDEHHHIAGTIDLISKSENGFEMYDWKRSKKIINVSNGEPIRHNQWQSGVGQLSDIDDTSYNRYCLQQSLYKYILEKNYGIKVSKMFLLIGELTCKESYLFLMEE